MAAEPQPASAGVVAMLGCPNVGKSSLLNALMRDPLAIVSRKPQTTRRALRGIVNHPRGQLVVVDTPGLAPAGSVLARAMRQATEQALLQADVSLAVCEVGGRGRSAASPLSPPQLGALAMAAGSGRPVVVALNKVDRLARREMLLPAIAEVAGRLSPRAVVPVSAQRGDGLAALVGELAACVPAGPPLHPEDMRTDAVERRLCEEFIFEQLMVHLHQEVPHRCAVVVETFEDLRQQPRPRCRIGARIVVERPGHRGIVIGRGGAMLRQIGRAARLRMQWLLGSPLYLELNVGVLPGWSARPAALREVGLLAAQP